MQILAQFFKKKKLATILPLEDHVGVLGARREICLCCPLTKELLNKPRKMCP